MAEPTNTPVPGSTPRSTSPISFHAPTSPGTGGGASILNLPLHHLTLAGYPTSPTRPTTATSKPRVLHIGDPIRYNPDTYLSLVSQCDLIRPSAEERQRPEFIKALQERRWGDFHAIFRPFWNSGGEMGKWDAELIDLLPSTVKVFASAGAGFDWADTKFLGEQGE